MIVQAAAAQVTVIGQYRAVDPANSLLNPRNVLGISDHNWTAVGRYKDSYGLPAWMRLPGFISAELRPRYDYRPGTDEVSEARFDVNELFVQFNHDRYLFAVGRKTVGWGVGYVFSPTDIMSRPPSPEDPEDMLFNIGGRDLIQFSAFILGSSQADLYVLPSTPANDDFQEGLAGAAHFYTNIASVDLGLVASIDAGEQLKLGGNTAIAVGQSLELHGELLFTRVNDMPYPGSEAGNPFGERDDGFFQLLIGGQESFTRSTNLALEYLFFSNGYAGRDWNRYLDTLRFLNRRLLDPLTAAEAVVGLGAIAQQEVLLRRRHYLFSRLALDDIVASLDAVWISFVELSSLSSFQKIDVEYAVGSHAEMYVQALRTFGPDTSEFKQSVAEGEVLVGLRWTF